MVRTFRVNELSLLGEHIEQVAERVLVAANNGLAQDVIGDAIDRTPVWVPNVYPKVPDHPSAKKTLGGETRASWRIFFGAPQFVHVADGEQPDPGGSVTKERARRTLAKATRLSDIWITNGREHIEILEFGRYPTLGRKRPTNFRLSIRGRLIQTNGGIFSTQAPRGMARMAHDYGRRQGLLAAAAAGAAQLRLEGVA